MALLVWIRFVSVFILTLFVLSCSVKNNSRRSPSLFKLRDVSEESQGSGDGPRQSAFSDWSEWSRCSRKCRQHRSRLCLFPEICDNRIKKSFRTCHSSNCRNKLLVLPYSGNRSSKHRILLHLQPYLYTEWSTWSSCSKSCLTKRTRTCKFSEICGKNVVQEDYNPCYREGDHCEQKYLEQMQQADGDFKPDSSLEDPEVVPEHPLDEMKCGVAEVSADLRIIGGRRTVKDSWPWQALILNKYREPFCGGILVAADWVLTAAHCIRHRLFVRAGDYDLAEIEGTEQEERVIESFVYPDYDPRTVDYDLALLKLRTPFTLNRHVKPVCLPDAEDELHLYARATILGWGKRRNEANFGTDVLHQAEVPIVPSEECRDSYDSYYISDNMLCAGYEAGKVDSCAGDSGGPLMHKREDGTWAVYGITSFGDGCGEKGKYGVYASVTSTVPWIRNIIRRHWAL